MARKITKIIAVGATFLATLAVSLSPAKAIVVNVGFSSYAGNGSFKLDSDLMTTNNQNLGEYSLSSISTFTWNGAEYQTPYSFLSNYSDETTQWVMNFPTTLGRWTFNFDGVVTPDTVAIATLTESFLGGSVTYMQESFDPEYGEAIVSEISTDIYSLAVTGESTNIEEDLEPTEEQTNNPVSVPEPTATSSLFTICALGAVSSLKRKMKRKGSLTV